MLNNKWLVFVLRWLLGLIFIYASYHKILDPGAFAKIVYGYGLVPAEIINLVAIILPFLELTTGMALLTGVWKRSAALVIMGMLAIFIVMISINLIRGHEFDCGCFASGNTNPIFAGSSLVTLIRDLVLFAVGLHVYSFNERRSRVTGVEKQKYFQSETDHEKSQARDKKGGEGH
jgi:uncharacterized membrane protein YphA (DoxX/SURF4 family)